MIVDTLPISLLIFVPQLNRKSMIKKAWLKKRKEKEKHVPLKTGPILNLGLQQISFYLFQTLIFDESKQRLGSFETFEDLRKLQVRPAKLEKLERMECINLGFKHSEMQKSFTPHWICLISHLVRSWGYLQQTPTGVTWGERLPSHERITIQMFTNDTQHHPDSEEFVCL